ncbi:MAG: hypothetical protein M3Z95_04055, partial [Actinomycetota bacterium]|nr:hypothetical protein [Actinomycetota bacterium]
MGGIPSGFAESEPGAVAAAASYLRRTEAAVLDGSGALSVVIRALTVEPLRSQALAAQPASRLFSRARAAGPWFARGYRLGYRLDSYSPSAAQVAVWTFGLAAGVIPTLTDWSTTTLQLRFTAGDWKVSQASTAPGPIPPPANASPQSDAAFARAAQTFKE